MTKLKCKNIDIWYIYITYPITKWCWLAHSFNHPFFFIPFFVIFNFGSVYFIQYFAWNVCNLTRISRYLKGCHWSKNIAVFFFFFFCVSCRFAHVCESFGILYLHSSTNIWDEWIYFYYKYPSCWYHPSHITIYNVNS